MVPKGSDTYRSAGVFTCCQHIVPVTLTGPECKGIRDRFALPLSGRGAIHGLGSVKSVERMQHDPHSLDIQIPRMHKDTLDGCFLPSLCMLTSLMAIQVRPIGEVRGVALIISPLDQMLPAMFAPAHQNV